MASTTSQLTVPEAIKIVKQHQHGEIDPAVTSFLAQIADDIWQRIQAQPSAYVLTREEFSVFNYYRNVFGDDEVVQQAIARFWNQFPSIIPRLSHNSDRQPLSDKSTTADSNRDACIRCRLRKVKCNGKLPCRSCKKVSLACGYTDSREDRTLPAHMRKSFPKESDYAAIPLQQDSVQLEDQSHLKGLDAADRNQVADGCDLCVRWKSKRIREGPICQHYDEENSQARTRNLLEARYKENSQKREKAWEGHREPPRSDIIWTNQGRKQDGSPPRTWKEDRRYSGLPEAPGVINPHEKSEVFSETREKRNQSTASEDSRVKQDEQTPQMYQRYPESPGNLSMELARLSMHVTNGEEYSLVNTLKVWVQSLTRESWDWWPLHPSFRQLREDEVRIKWYCVSRYPRCLTPSLLNLLKGFRARTLDSTPQDRACSFVRDVEG